MRVLTIQARIENETKRPKKRIGKKLLKKKTKQVVMRKHSGRFQVVQVATKPQQENGNNCGIYVLHYLQVIRNVVEANGVDYFAKHVGSICRGFTAEMCRRDRKELLIILNS